MTLMMMVSVTIMIMTSRFRVTTDAAAALNDSSTHMHGVQEQFHHLAWFTLRLYTCWAHRFLYTFLIDGFHLDWEGNSSTCSWAGIKKHILFCDDIENGDIKCLCRLSCQQWMVPSFRMDTLCVDRLRQIGSFYFQSQGKHMYSHM